MGGGNTSVSQYANDQVQLQNLVTLRPGAAKLVEKAKSAGIFQNLDQEDELMNLKFRSSPGYMCTSIGGCLLQNLDQDDDLINLRAYVGAPFGGGRLQNLKGIQWGIPLSAAAVPLDEDELINLSRAIYPQPPRERSTEQFAQDYYRAYGNYYNGRLQNLIRADEISKGISDAKGIYDQIKGFKFQNLDAHLI